MTEAVPAGSPGVREEGLPVWLRRALVVEIDGVEFGIPVLHVREVLPLPPITRLPYPPPSILGVVNIRGAIVAVLDLAERLFGRGARAGGRLVIATEPGSGAEVGLRVDRVIDLIELEGIPAAEHEVNTSLPEGWVDRILAPRSDRLVTLLHLGPVLAAHEPGPEESR